MEQVLKNCGMELYAEVLLDVKFSKELSIVGLTSRRSDSEKVNKICFET